MSWLYPRAFVKMASNDFSARLLVKYFLLFCFAVLVTSSDTDEQSDNGRRVLTVASNNPPESDDSNVVSGNQGSTSAGSEDGYKDTEDVVDIGMEVEVPVMEADLMGSDNNQEDVADASKENSGSFFSFENILKSVIQPVLEELNNGKSEDVKADEKRTLQETEPVPVLQSEAPVQGYNMTSGDIPEGPENNTAAAATETEKTAKKLKFQCQGKNVTENDTALVKIVNGTELLNMISFKNNESRSDCVLVMFYAPWCHFSAQTAPHYNALGRAYPNLDVLAVDAIHFSNLNARFGTVSVPNILLFHQSRAVVKFNQSTRSLDNFVQFVKNLTGLEPNMSVLLEDQDYLGPLSSVPTVETDYLLWLAWVFVCAGSTYMFTVSSAGQHIINRVNVLWQEHQHIE